jgi:hypothetical protein
VQGIRISAAGSFGHITDTTAFGVGNQFSSPYTEFFVKQKL